MSKQYPGLQTNSTFEIIPLMSFNYAAFETTATCQKAAEKMHLTSYIC
jgi:hypothetical protein